MFRFLLHSTTVLAVLAGLFGLTACQTQNIRAGRPLVNLVRPTDLPTEPKTTRAAQMISLETPLRCTIEETQKNIMTAVPFKQEAFKLERAEQSDTLPLFEVKGFSFDGQTAEKVFYKLLSGAKIKVIGVDGPFPELAAENITGELSDVMEMIASAADVYYRYDAKQKTLFVSREIGWNLFVPDRREVMIAVLDSLRGAGMHDLSVNWEENVISFKGDKGTENKVRQLIDLFDKEPNLIVFNVQVLRVKPLSPAKEINWQDLIETFGAGTIRVSVNGVLGRSLVTAHKINAQSLSRFLTPRAVRRRVRRHVHRRRQMARPFRRRTVRLYVDARSAAVFDGADRTLRRPRRIRRPRRTDENRLDIGFDAGRNNVVQNEKHAGGQYLADRHSGVVFRRFAQRL